MYNLIILVFLLLLGYGAGRCFEYRHYRSILRREDVFRNLPAKFPPESELPYAQVERQISVAQGYNPQTHIADFSFD